MKRFIGFMCLAVALLLGSCGNKAPRGEGDYAGSFTDEFENKFVLNDDFTATIQFVGEDKINETTWNDGKEFHLPYATIAFNGNPAYYYLRDGKLYRHRENMQKGTSAIRIKYND